jgi:hypothetical protein
VVDTAPTKRAAEKERKKKGIDDNWDQLNGSSRGGIGKEEGRTHPCRSRLWRRWRTKAARHLRRSRALPRARSPSLLRERAPRLAREGDRAYTHLRIQSNRTYFVFVFVEFE